MSAPRIVTSNSFRSFSQKQIELLRADALQKSKGEVLFLEEMHFYSQNLKGYTGDVTGAIFWSEKLPKGVKNAQHFFCFYCNGVDSLRVTGLPDFDPVIDAVYVPKSNVIGYSRAQHDFYYITGGVAVDGGRDYTRILGSEYEVVKFNLLTRKFKSKTKGRWQNVAI